jgi:hypothetical protein
VERQQAEAEAAGNFYTKTGGIMPYGPGTYGSKRGRPPKKSKMSMSGKAPARKKKTTTKKKKR